MTPFLAAWTWKKFGARFLEKQGADVNFADPRSGRTTLHYGVEKEFDPTQLRWLISHGASPDVKDKNSVSARDRSCRASAKSSGSTGLDEDGEPPEEQLRPSSEEHSRNHRAAPEIHGHRLATNSL
jgi:hypothetical protein